MHTYIWRHIARLHMCTLISYGRAYDNLGILYGITHKYTLVIPLGAYDKRGIIVVYKSIGWIFLKYYTSSDNIEINILLFSCDILGLDVVDANIGAIFFKKCAYGTLRLIIWCDTGIHTCHIIY